MDNDSRLFDDKKEKDCIIKPDKPERRFVSCALCGCVLYETVPMLEIMPPKHYLCSYCVRTARIL